MSTLNLGDFEALLGLFVRVATRSKEGKGIEMAKKGSVSVSWKIKTYHFRMQR